MRSAVETVLSWACFLTGHPGACWVFRTRLGQWSMRHGFND